MLVCVQEMKKNKVRRDQVREVHSLLNNPDKIEEEVRYKYVYRYIASMGLFKYILHVIYDMCTYLIMNATCAPALCLDSKSAAGIQREQVG